MTAVSTLISQVLRAYPSHYPDPIDALLDIAGSHQAFEWREGEIVCLYQGLESLGSEMQYNDLDEKALRVEHMGNANEHAQALIEAQRLEISVERQRRAFVDTHMNIISQSDPTLCYTRPETLLSPVQRAVIHGTQPLSTHARFLNFPANISPDWAEALSKLHSWIGVKLRQEYRLSQSSVEGGRSQWPEHAKLLWGQVERAKEKLFDYRFGKSA